jgi:hypothetical protein
MERLSIMTKIVVEFSGYMHINLERTMFVRLSDSPAREFLTAKQWLALDDEYKDEYTIFDMEHAMDDAYEVGWNHCDTMVTDDIGVVLYSDRTYS